LADWFSKLTAAGATGSPFSEEKVKAAMGFPQAAKNSMVIKKRRIRIPIMVFQLLVFGPWFEP
jgi:hypothetical protein